MLPLLRGSRLVLDLHEPGAVQRPAAPRLDRRRSRPSTCCPCRPRCRRSLFSLSFPLELSVALLYPPPVAALIALLGSADLRELRGEIPPLKALCIRAQIAAVALREPGLQVVRRPGGESPKCVAGRASPVVLAAAIAGYAVNLLSSLYTFCRIGEEPVAGSSARSTSACSASSCSRTWASRCSACSSPRPSTEIGMPVDVLVFIAPLAFARQMFTRTHSLQEATNELAAKQAENEHQALHDSLTGLPNRLLFQQRLADAIDARARARRQHRA